MAAGNAIITPLNVFRMVWLQITSVLFNATQLVFMAVAVLIAPQSTIKLFSWMLGFDKDVIVAQVGR